MAYKNNNIQREIEPVKSKTINTLLVGLTLLTTPLIIISLTRTVYTGWQNAYYFHIGIYLFIIAAAIFRNKLKLRQKAVALTFILMLVAIIGFIYFGYVAGGKLFIIPAIVIGSLFYSKKFSYYTIAITILFISLLAYLYISGRLVYKFDINLYISKANSWISNGLTLITVSLILVIIVNRLENAYLNLAQIKSEQEENYRSLFEQAADGILICTKKGEILLVNHSFCSLTGYTFEEINGKSIKDFFNKEELIKSPIRYDLLEKGEVVVNERKALRKDGEIFEIESRSHLLKDGRIQIFIRDVTEINKLKTEWTREKELNDRILNIIPGIFFLWDLNGNIPRLIKWNKNHETFLGYDSYSLRGADIHKFFFKDEYEIIDKVLLDIEANQEFSIEINLRLKENIKIPYFLSTKAIEMNNKLYLLGVGLDISKRKAFEKELIESEQKFRDIYNNTSDAICIIAYNYKILNANQAFRNLLGLNNVELQDINVFDHVVSPEESFVKERSQQLLQTQSSSFEYTLRSTDNRIFPADTRSCLINYEGNPAILTTFNDISERKALEQEILNSTTLAEEKERERMAKELHDGLGPLLSTCRIYLYNLKNLKQKEEIDAVENLAQLVDEALSGIKEISNNISPHVLRNFGIVHATKNFIERLSEKCNVSFDYNFDPSKRFDEIKEITAYRLLTELINNTIKHANANNINIKIMKVDNMLNLSYTDNGIGFDYEKMIKANKGLGLSNIESRVNSTGGILKYISKPGKGVNVTINLPLN